MKSHIIDGKEFINVKSACEMLGVGKHTLYNWIKEGKIPHIRLSVRKVWISKSTIEKMLQISN